MKNSDIDFLDLFLNGEKSSDSFDDQKAEDLLIFNENSFDADPFTFNDDQQVKNQYDFEEY